MIVRIQGSTINSISEFHKMIREKLNFPDYYGDNLDALWDLLTQYPDELTIILEELDDLYAALGSKAFDLVQMFMDLSRERDDFVFILLGGVCE